jgi:hypothetical protein
MGLNAYPLCSRVRAELEATLATIGRVFQMPREPGESNEDYSERLCAACDIREIGPGIIRFNGTMAEAAAKFDRYFGPESARRDPG